MRKTTSRKACAIDALPPDPEAALRAYERRTSKPPPRPRARSIAFDVMVEEFIAKSAKEADPPHQK